MAFLLPRLAAAALGMTGSLMAATITINMVTGSWQNAVQSEPAPNTIVIVNGFPASTIDWGVPDVPPLPLNRSGYTFTSLVPPAVGTPIPPSPTPWLDLGEFLHRNHPTNPPVLASVELSILLNMDVDGTAVDRSFVFNFTHEETPNDPPCPYGPPAGPCNDRVTVAGSLTPVTFNVEGVDYTLELRFLDPTGNPVTSFVTAENADNMAILEGRFIRADVIIPEPGTVSIMLIGLAGLVYGRFRRR
jgi:hypothetical protein